MPISKLLKDAAKRCSYCVIPTIKGPLKSKSKEQILKEFNYLLNQGVHEIILIAQDLEITARIMAQETSSPDRSTQIMLAIDKRFWLRLLYLYPDEITDELIALMKSDSRICPYLDMPIQHINNQI